MNENTTMRGYNTKYQNKNNEYEYYNHDLKQTYIDERNDKVTLSPGTLERLFTKTSTWESELGKDVCCFSSLEIKDMYKTMSFISQDSVANFNSQLSLYTTWCIDHNMVYDCQNHYLEIKDYDNYVDIRLAKRKIITRKELLSKSRDLNPCDRFVLLGVFEGINGLNRVELINLKLDDFHKDNTVTLCTGRTIKVSDQLIEIARESDATTYYESPNGRRIKFTGRGEYIIKTFSSAREDISDLAKGRRIYFRLEKNLKYIGLDDLSINSICDSGRIHMIKELAKENGITPKQVLQNEALVKKINEQFGLELRERVFLRKYESYLEPDVEGDE